MTPSIPSGSRGGRLAAIGFSVVLLGALFFPASAINENQAPSQPLQLTVETITSGAFLGQIRDALSANFGLKALAVRTIAPAHLALGASPNPAVYLAPGGEPFLSEDFVGACSNDLERFDFAASYERLVASNDEGGRQLVFAVVPDKGSIDRQQLEPNAQALLSCSDHNRAYVETIPSIVTAWDQFEASNDELYFFGDSHWNYTGASIFAVALLERLQPGIVKPSDLLTSQQQHSGDLFVLMGVEKLETTTVIEAHRPAVETVYDSEVTSLGYTVQRWQSTGDADFLPGRTLIVHDSTFAYNSAVYAPYFEDLTSVPIQAITEPGAIASLGDYDRVIVQRVQRGLLSDLDLLITADWL